MILVSNGFRTYWSLAVTDFASVQPQLIRPVSSRFIVAAQGMAWFSPERFPGVGSLTRVEPQPQTPPGLTSTPRALLRDLPPLGHMAKQRLPRSTRRDNRLLALAPSAPQATHPGWGGVARPALLQGPRRSNLPS